MVAEASLRRGAAFAPAHVTGFFSPRLAAADPRARGSIGGGLVLDVGVHVTAEWRPGRPARVHFEGPPTAQLTISREVAERLLARRPGRLTVRLEQDVPTGQGFGSSSAGAVATALAVAQALELPRKTAVEVAHLADLFGRGGLGGVAAILGGGLELRIRAGIPPWGRTLRCDLPARIMVGVVGPPVRSPRVLRAAGAEERFSIGAELVEEVRRDPAPESFWGAAQRFSDEVGLESPPLERLLRGLRRRGAYAAQAMFGNSFFATSIRASAERDLYRWLAARTSTLGLVEVAHGGARPVHAVRGRGTEPLSPGAGGARVF